MEDAHEEDAVEARQRQEAQGADRGEARACLGGEPLPAVRRKVGCRERLQKGDTAYTVRVRPVSKFDAKEKGDWAESPSTYIPEEKAARFRENPTGGNGEWAQTPENGRWWYRNADGSYPANSWQQIGGKWYFFDAQGYMVTGWVQWDGKEYYCSDNGEMLTNCLTPDSFWVGEDGAKINQ